MAIIREFDSRTVLGLPCIMISPLPESYIDRQVKDRSYRGEYMDGSFNHKSIPIISKMDGA